MMRQLSICVIAIVLGACGGAAAPSAQAPATAPAAAVTAAQAAATSAPAATPSGPNVADLLKAGKLSTYKVTYKWTIVAGGQTQTSEQTWYYKAPKARFDFSAGPGSLFSVFTLEDGTYVCTTAGGQSFCQKSPGGSGLDANPAASFGLQFQDHPEQFNASFQGTRSIAGQTAQCYGVKSIAAGAFGDVTSCYSSNGVPLLTKMTSQGQEFTMEASNFSTTVTDADFKLPAAAN
jgi:outer membrane lipoprotein-sorting protein